MEVAFLYHSGFLVEMEHNLLLFDYWQPGKPTFDADLLDCGKRVTVFASHAHGDHFDSVICDWKKSNLRRVLSSDIPAQYEGKRISPGQTLTLDDMRVSALNSTDQGVAFIVEAEGKTIFHAGDLNLWSWKDASTEAEVEEARAAFLAAIAPLKGISVDLCFFPVDARMGSDFDEGALWVLANVRPKVFIPMHFTGHAEAVNGFAERAAHMGDIRLLLRSGDKTKL